MGRDLIDYNGNLSPRVRDKRPIRRYRIVDSLPYWFEGYFMSIGKDSTTEEI